MRPSNGFCVSGIANHAHVNLWLTPRRSLGTDTGLEPTISHAVTTVARIAVEEAETRKHQPAPMVERGRPDTHTGLRNGREDCRHILSFAGPPTGDLDRAARRRPVSQSRVP